MSRFDHSPDDSDLLVQLTERFPYQFQQWAILREHSPLHDRRGWQQLFSQLCEQVHEVLPPAQRKKFSWLAVRARGGAMRSYFAGELNPEVSRLVRSTEIASLSICEVCGRAGQLHSFGNASAARCAYHAVELAARTLLGRERRLAPARPAQMERRLAQWMLEPCGFLGGLPPQAFCATSHGTALLLEMLTQRLDPQPALKH